MKLVFAHPSHWFFGSAQSVYGRSASFDFPLNMRTFNFFYRDILPPAAKSSLVWAQGSPTTGDLISSVDGWFDPSSAGTAGPGASYGTQGQPVVHSVWVYLYPSAGCPHGSWPHAAPSFQYSSGFPSNSIVEVMHTCCDNVRNGFWTYLAIGSGIAMQLGTTKVFTDHQAAFEELGLPVWNNPDFTAMVTQARARGWDTLQFTHRCENTYKYEILDVRERSLPNQPGPCPTTGQEFRSGWKGERACQCSQTANICTNCKIDNAAFPK